MRDHKQRHVEAGGANQMFKGAKRLEHPSISRPASRTV